MPKAVRQANTAVVSNIPNPPVERSSLFDFATGEEWRVLLICAETQSWWGAGKRLASCGRPSTFDRATKHQLLALQFMSLSFPETGLQVFSLSRADPNSIVAPLASAL